MSTIAGMVFYWSSLLTTIIGALLAIFISSTKLKINLNEGCLRIWCCNHPSLYHSISGQIQCEVLTHCLEQRIIIHNENQYLGSFKPDYKSTFLAFLILNFMDNIYESNFSPMTCHSIPPYTISPNTIPSNTIPANTIPSNTIPANTIPPNQYHPIL